MSREEQKIIQGKGETFTRICEVQNITPEKEGKSYRVEGRE